MVVLFDTLKGKFRGFLLGVITKRNRVILTDFRKEANQCFKALAGIPDKMFRSFEQKKVKLRVLRFAQNTLQQVLFRIFCS